MADLAINRFKSKTLILGNRCWLWMGSLTSSGYGCFRNEHVEAESAHRFSYRAHIGPVPDDVCVLHTCDHPWCVNPDHLWLGSRNDNNWDKSRKGRALGTGGARGEKHPLSKLNASQIAEIRLSDLSESALAAKYGVSRSLIGNIKRRETWRHLGAENG